MISPLHLEIIGILISSILISCVGYTMLTILREKTAALRFQVLMGLFLVLLALPALHNLLPVAQVPLFQIAKYIDTGEEPYTHPRTLVRVSQSVRDAITGDEPIPTAGSSADAVEKSHPGPWWRTGTHALETVSPWLLFGVWLAGALTVLTIQLVRWTGAGFIAEMATSFGRDRDATPVDSNAVTGIAATIKQEMGIDAAVPVLKSELAAVSMVWGLINPCVILPAEADEWAGDKIEAVLRHEFSHIGRRDNLSQIIAVLTCSFYWINPFVWLALRRFHFEREVACDDSVINAGVLSSSYAKHLMEITMQLNGPKSQSMVPAIMAHSSDLKRRLKLALDPATRRTPMSGAMKAVWIVMLLLLTIPLSTVRLWTTEADADQIFERFDPNLSDFDLRFNGTHSYVEVPHAPEFNFQDDFTLEMIVNVANLSTSGQDQLLLTKHRSHVTDGGEWAWSIMGPPNQVGRMQFSVWSEEGGATAESFDGAVQESGDHCADWQTLAFCYEKSTGNWEFFVNGVSAGSGTDDLPIGAATRSVNIGWEENEPWHNFKGWIRALRISDTCRYSGGYDAGAVWSNDAGTLALYDFSDGTGNVLSDVSGNGHDGTIFNCLWDACQVPTEDSNWGRIKTLY
ncbi:MAG: hypothetical protein GY835_13980 [bacterium]|nr:hypothetical protein [bacterium]